MADPLNLVVTVVNGILALVKEAKTNQEGCQLLATLAQRTLSTLKQLENRELTDPSMTTALEHVNDALSDAHNAIEECCKSNFFLAILHRENYAASLKEAAGKLEHALSQVSLASVSMTAEIQSELAKLSDHVRKAKFNERAEIAHQSKALKDELEKAFFKTGEGTEEVKGLIREMMQEHSSSAEDMKKELVTLKEYANNAHVAKENQHEFELNQIIAVLSESLGEGSRERKIAQDLKDCIFCPISKEIMRDPVLLRESGMIYDRSNIVEWLRRGHHHDPLTNVELTSGEFFPCPTLKSTCRSLLEQSGASPSFVDNPQVEEIESQRMVPGLYEGHGKLMIDSKIIHASQVLVLQPSGLALGCCLYEKVNNLPARNVLEIGSGEWERSSLQLSFEDDRYIYNGEVELGINGQHLGMKWTGKVSTLDAPDEKHIFVFVCSVPYVSHSIWARPGILQMESDIVSARNNVKYNNKLVLALQDDSTIEGCMWFEGASSDTKTIGNVVGGSWDSDSFLTFKVEFSQTDKTRWQKNHPTDNGDCYRVSGALTQDGRVDDPAFTAMVVKATSYSASTIDLSSYVPLEDVKQLEYSYVREATTPWYRFVPGPLHMFESSDDYELESGDYCIAADLDIGDGIVRYHLVVARDQGDLVTPSTMQVVWVSSRIHDAPYWVRAAIWEIERIMPNGGYKVTLNKHSRNIERAKKYIGSTLNVWQDQDPNRKRGECYLCVSETSRTEDHSAWTLKGRHGGYFYFALEPSRNPKIAGGSDYFLSHPVPKQDTRDVYSQFALLTRNRGNALRITLEQPR